MTEHLDLDALADVLAQPGEALPEHLTGCADCQAALTALETAVGQVGTALTALPQPPVPDDLAGRLDAAVARERRGAGAAPATTVTPLAAAPGRRPRWLLVAGGLAAAAVLVTGGLLAHGGSSTPPTADRQQATGAAPGIARSSTGNAYAKDGKALAAALPGLLKGDAPAASADAGATAAESAPKAPAPTRPLASVDPLAALRTSDALASCLASLSDPSDPGVPLALDYATFDGQPALVVVLPATKPDKVDVFVVGAGCSAKDAALLFFTRLPRP
jgi:hypothetical protein